MEANFLFYFIFQLNNLEANIAKKGIFTIISCMLKEIAQLVRGFNRQSKDPGSNPGTVGGVSSSREEFTFLQAIVISLIKLIFYVTLNSYYFYSFCRI